MIISKYDPNHPINSLKDKLILTFGGKCIRVWTLNKDDFVDSITLSLDKKEIKKLYSIIKKVV
jgi:hypothetical protein